MESTSSTGPAFMRLNQVDDKRHGRTTRMVDTTLQEVCTHSLISIRLLDVAAEHFEREMNSLGS